MPFESTDGSAKHCWFAGQRPCEVSNCPFTQEAMAPWKQVVSPSIAQKKKTLNFNNNDSEKRKISGAYYCKNL